MRLVCCGILALVVAKACSSAEPGTTHVAGPLGLAPPPGVHLQQLTFRSPRVPITLDITALAHDHAGKLAYLGDLDDVCIESRLLAETVRPDGSVRFVARCRFELKRDDDDHAPASK